ncbi:MAG: chemotaxis-specific protein-glutamate methyltransferase CheB [Phycisphaerales bacterium]
MRVLVVDDSAFMRKVITQMIDETPGLEVVGFARNGVEGVKLAEELNPDLITLDIEMPELDGLGALRQIRIKCRKNNPAVLMCSSLTTDGSTEAFKALRLGAADVIAKDPATVGKRDEGFRKELISKLKAIAGERRRATSASSPSTLKIGGKPDTPKPPAPSKSPADLDLDNIDAVVIGSSTGGPPVLEDILGGMPAGLRVPVFVAQHMPPLFTKTLSQRLDQHCICNVKLISERTAITEPGVYVAEGGRHMHITRHPATLARAEMRDEPEEAVYRPSVDVLFSTASRVFGKRTLAIQLTGMGEDGAKGAQDIRTAGGRVITQSAETCVVYGMPKAVVESGNSDAQLTPTQITGILAQLCGPTSSQIKSEDRKSA